MENKKNSKGLIVLVIILVLCVLGLAGYIVYDKVLNKKTPIIDIKECIPTQNKETENNVENTDENSFLDKYISETINYSKDYEILNNDDYKSLIKKYIVIGNNIVDNENEVSINNTVLSETPWNKISKYVDNKELYSEMTENSSIKTVKYEDLLNTKKQLYGDNSSLKKESFNYSNCSEYLYIKELDIFIENNEGCGFTNSEEPIIKLIIKQNDSLFIFINTYNYTDIENKFYSQDIVMEFREQSSGYYLYKLTKLN